MAHERQRSITEFLFRTKLAPDFFVAAQPTQVRRAGRELVAEDQDGREVERLGLKDATPELGEAIEENLHYLGTPRTDCTHRVVLAEKSTDFPVLYMSFVPNTRRYFEPLLWAFGLRMDEVVVAARGYGSPRCPRNAMSLFLRMACKRVSDDYGHIRAIITDINPNWGYSGTSFREAGFVTVALKHAPPSFVGDDYYSRRALDDATGDSIAIQGRIPLVPTLVMVKAFDEKLSQQLDSSASEGLYVIPQDLYDKK